MTRGENIYKRKDGRWEGRYKKGYGPNKKIRYGYCYGHSYREVKEKLNRAKANHVSQEAASAKLSTQEDFSYCCWKWIRIHESRWKKSTLAKYSAVLEKHINPYLGAYRMDELNSDIMAGFSEELLNKKHLSGKTVRDILTLVHEMIVSIQQDSGTVLPITICYPKSERKELRVLSLTEQHRLTQYLFQDMDQYKFSVLLALFTGLRIGEICALQWKHVSLDKRVLTVKQTIQRIKNPDTDSEQKTLLLLGSPKTISSIRTVPIIDGLLPFFERFKQDDPEICVITGTYHFAEPRKLQRKFKTYTEDLGLRDVHFHTLRHTFATRCIELGCDTKTLSEILGHSNISTTMNRYVHPSLDLKRKNITKLEESGVFPSSDEPSELSTFQEHLT